MPTSYQRRTHADAIARLAASVWQWLESRNLAPANPLGSPPEIALYGYAATGDERADEAVSIFQEVVTDFANAGSGSEVNARYPELAEDTLEAVDLLELVFSMPIQRFIQQCRSSENARRMCARAGIDLEEIERARYAVVLAMYSLRDALKHFFDVWSVLAPDVRKRGVSSRAKDPMLSYFDWMLSTVGWSPEEIADIDGSYWDIRAGQPEHRAEDQLEAARATAKRISRMAEFLARH